MKLLQCMNAWFLTWQSLCMSMQSGYIIANQIWLSTNWCHSRRNIFLTIVSTLKLFWVSMFAESSQNIFFFIFGAKCCQKFVQTTRQVWTTVCFLSNEENFGKTRKIVWMLNLQYNWMYCLNSLANTSMINGTSPAVPVAKPIPNWFSKLIHVEAWKILRHQ